MIEKAPEQFNGRACFRRELSVVKKIMKVITFENRMVFGKPLPPQFFCSRRKGTRDGLEILSMLFDEKIHFLQMNLCDNHCVRNELQR